MRTALAVLTDELRRLKATGIATIAVSGESLDALRRAMAERVRAAPAPGAPSPSVERSPAHRVVVGTAAGPPAPAGSGDETGASAGESFPPCPLSQLPGGTKRERWEALKAQVLADSVCRSHVRPGKKVVLGVGSLEARIMFVGEAPGADEEIQGEPFVGPAGRLLTKMIQAMGLQREEVYIGNIMNWRPQLPVNGNGVQYGNRPPTAAEMAYCLPYLKAQIDIVAPEYLVALGATAAQGLLGPGTFKALGEIRGRWRDFAGRPLMVTYHPSYILRNPTNRSKRMIWEDLLRVMERAGLPITEKQRGYFPDK